jgi:hypothetical protein
MKLVLGLNVLLTMTETILSMCCNKHFICDLLSYGLICFTGSSFDSLNDLQGALWWAMLNGPRTFDNVWL